MKNKLLILFASLLLAGQLVAQDSDIQQSSGFATVNEATQMADQIVKAAGMKKNFIIAEARVQNAVAVLYMGQRYIFYNPRFIEQLTKLTGTKWAAVSVLAHEIGHHLYANSVNKGKMPLATESEADEFSGYVLQKMGATLAEAEVAMKTMGNKYATTTYPSRDGRIAAIVDGWKSAGGIVTEEDEPVTATPVYAEKNSSVVPRDMIAASIRFDASPGTEYYVTKKRNILKVAGEEVSMIGRITTSDSEMYPLIIYDGTGFRLYVDNEGEIVDGKGKNVGRLKVEL